MGVERGKTSRSHSSQQVVGLRGSHVSPVFVTRDVLSFGSSAAQGHAMPCVVKLAIRGVIRCTLSEVYFTVMSAAAPEVVLWHIILMALFVYDPGGLEHESAWEERMESVLIKQNL